MRPLLAVLLFGCLWDYDTIRMETKAFPGVHEMLAGKFTRHSRDYYEWRIEDRAQRLRERPGDPKLLDDLAVAYDKTGRTDDAIALMRESLEKNPDRYETIANLGTFLIHAGRHDDGLAYLRRAVEINPDAHFGRERIQIHVVEYVSAWRRAGLVGLPLGICDEQCAREQERRRAFEALEDDALIDALAPCFECSSRTGLGSAVVGFVGSHGSLAREPAALVKGIVGMMFFGNHDHPVLAECLGFVLVHDGHLRLACRAFLKASYAAGDPEAAAHYRWLANEAIRMQAEPRGAFGGLDRVELDEVEAAFRQEREEGQRFFARIAEAEARWRAEGLDLDEEFGRHDWELEHDAAVEAALSGARRARGISAGWIALAGAAAALVYVMIRPNPGRRPEMRRR